MSKRITVGIALAMWAMLVAAPARAQSSSQQPAGAPVPTPPLPTQPPPAPTWPDYVIGPDDVLTVLFWRDKDLSGDVTVRPDGKVSLLLVNDIQAAGLTVEQLRVAITSAAARYVESPTVTVVSKQINSRRVYITGAVAKSGPVPLTDHMTIAQLIAVSGGLLEFADEENITLLRPIGGQFVSYRINFKDLMRRKNLLQNMELKVGDTILVN